MNKIEELTLFFVGFNSFMFIWSYIGMPGMASESGWGSAASFFVTFGIGAAIGLMLSLAARAIFNVITNNPSANERSTLWAFLGVLFGGTFFGFLAKTNALLVSMGMEKAMVLVDIIEVFIGIVFIFTITRWVTGAE